MAEQFIGRIPELENLTHEYKKSHSNLIVLYGRRRIGKSALVAHFSRQFPNISIDGLEHQSTIDQIDHFRSKLNEQISDPILEDVVWTQWSKALDYLTRYINSQNKKVVVFLDEYQWLSCQQSKLTALIKSYWDNSWKNSGKICLILCGSVSSFMVSKVIHSKSLYGRIHLELQIGPLNLMESFLLLQKKRSLLECLKYYLIFGGVPKYLESIQTNQSYIKNIESLCFEKTGSLYKEYDKIFCSQFKEPRTYERIISYLETGAKTYSEIIEHLKIKDGGGAKSYLTNLEITGFINSISNPFKTAREKKYFISDEFLRFYHKYIKKYKEVLTQGYSQKVFQNQIIPNWSPWLGLAFEFFCVKNSALLARIMGFEDDVISAGPFYLRGTSDLNGFQVDLIYNRGDIITVCEIKFTDKPIGTEIIDPFINKVNKLRPHIANYNTLEYALIAPSGITTALKKKNFFHHVVILEDLFQK
jgi:AAA+ ATPase superfamily predicted ATPase